MASTLLSARAGPVSCVASARRATPNARATRSAALAPLRHTPASSRRIALAPRRAAIAPKAVLDVDESTFEAEVLKVRARVSVGVFVCVFCAEPAPWSLAL